MTAVVVGQPATVPVKCGGCCNKRSRQNDSKKSHCRDRGVGRKCPTIGPQCADLGNKNSCKSATRVRGSFHRYTSKDAPAFKPTKKKTSVSHAQRCRKGKSKQIELYS